MAEKHHNQQLAAAASSAASCTSAVLNCGDGTPGFILPAEKHVSVDSHELKMAIKNRLELEDRVVFDDLCKLMEGVANFDFFDLKDR
jgi:hypothetical protein